jgi:D-xylose 1-dehydrogenase (NADP+, D-xylono-1,5-lactone-forming)
MYFFGGCLMSQVRWGLVSTANINKRLIPAIRASRRGELVAVASRTAASAESYAQEWEIPRAFASYEAMLASDEVDAVYISLPNHLHAEWTIKALRAGKHVLCEKPFALSLNEVDGMIAAAQETGLVLAEAFMYRHHPQTKLWGNGCGRPSRSNHPRSSPVQLRRAKSGQCAPTAGMGRRLSVGRGRLPGQPGPVCDGRAAPEWVVGSQRLGATGVDEFFAGQLHYGDGRIAQIAPPFAHPFTRPPKSSAQRDG